MGIKNYVRQVRPVQEAHVNHLEKIQRFLTESDTEQDLVEKTISVEFNKLKGSSNPITDALLDEKEYSKISEINNIDKGGINILIIEK